MMERIIIESPFWNEDSNIRELNLRYARLCLFDSLKRGEAPFASHLLYPQVLLDEKDPIIRQWGIEAGFKWMLAVNKIAVYTDRGISSGMQQGINFAKKYAINIEYRSLEGEKV